MQRKHQLQPTVFSNCTLSDMQVAFAVYRKVTELPRNPDCIWIIMKIVSVHWTLKLGTFFCT
jgi:hypothetical protein